MKLIVIVTLALLAVCVKAGGEEVMKIIQACKTEVGATDEDLGKMATNAPEGKVQKCMFSCMMAGANVIKDGKLNKDGYMALSTILTGGDAGKMKIAGDIFEECKKLEGDADPCEAASKIGYCIKSNGDKNQITFM